MKKKPRAMIGKVPVWCAHDKIVSCVELKPNPKNPNTHPTKQIKLLGKIIAEQGWRMPITVSKRSGLIVKGHARLEAAFKAGILKAPVDLQDYESEAAEHADMVADNRLAELAAIDDDKLSELLSELSDFDIDMDLTGFFDDELKKLLGEQEGLTNDDAVPEVPDDPVTKTGDLYLLGDHRLLCGDATSKEDVERLMDGKKADMVFNDPPYALFGSSTGVANVVDDKMVRPFFRDVFSTCRNNTKLYAHIYICCDWHSAFSLEGMAREQKLTAKNLCIWDKGDGGLGAMYQQCYEMIWFFSNSPISNQTLGRKKIGDGERTINGKPNIWRHLRENIDRKHNAQKPSKMIANAINNSTDKGESCADFFGGSGSTLIACEKTGRKCYMMEIDPHYCDVIVKRWEDYTGSKAKLI